MSRAQARLEVLPLEFFSLLFASATDDLQILSVTDEGKVVSAALICFQDNSCYFLLVGQLAARNDRIDPYFNLVHGVIELAIKRGSKKLMLGQTAYWTKQRVGATPSARNFYFKSTNPLIHQLVRAFKDVLFPGVSLPQITVFKSHR
jgi:hypothetical protein